jgi:hypothetical protein
MPRYTEKQIEDALKQTKGMVYLASRQLGCSYHTIQARIAKSVKLQQIVKNESGLVVDTAELKLYQAILDGDMGAIKYMLSTRGKDRGYVEKQQVEQQGELILKVQYGDDGAKSNPDNSTAAPPRSAKPISQQ